MTEHRFEKYLMIVIIILVVLFVALAGTLIYRYHALRSAGFVSQGPWLFSLFHHHPRPLTVSQVNLIQPWMTFEYISRAFNVPTSTIASALTVSDAKFPHTTIAAYANR